MAVALVFSVPAESQTPLPSSPFTYADMADLALPVPVVVHVRVARSARLKGADAATVPAGKARFYVEADIVSLIKGPSGLSPKVVYLADLPVDAAARAPKLARKSEHILFASPVAGRPGELRLAAPDAQIAWSAPDAERVRAILRDAARADAPPRISGLGRAFHVPGTLPGESETQIFLQAADGRPVSLSVLRRPGEQPRWAVALAEIVDDAAGPPARDSLLWYRLACTLPSALPSQSLADADTAQANAIRADYRLVIDRLGPCARNRALGRLPG
ncbi:MAG: hypothetical protein H0W74_06410 [Sphingosinicella sp.]|nr:hypothetical protein [Sphingosinicella sp.]